MRIIIVLFVFAIAAAAQVKQAPAKKVFDPAGTPYLTMDRDVAGKTLRYAPPGQPPVVIRQYPGRFGSITVQQGTETPRRLGSTK